MTNAIIQVENSSFTYGETQNGGIFDLNLHISAGECVVLCGRSGCGKTTVTKMVNGLIPHFEIGNISGYVRVANQNIARTPMYLLARTIASVFQNPKSQFFHLDPESEITFTLENQAEPLDKINARLEKTVRELQLEALMEKTLFGMSGGEKQLIAFACAYASDATVIVLDEPSANLDKTATRKITAVMTKMKTQGKTILIAEHRLNWLKGLADRVCIFQGGKLIETHTGSYFYAQNDDWRISHGLRSLEKPRLIMTQNSLEKTAHTIDFRNIQLSYGKEPVLDGFNLTLRSGEVTALTGQNGAGKTTLSRCLCGLHKEDLGYILLDGKKLKAKERRNISYLVMQDVNHQLFAESVEAECMLSGSRQSEIAPVLHEFDLYALKDRHPQALSGGQKQRLAVVTALLSGKQLLIFDEPTSGLDYENMLRVSATLQQLAEKDCFVLVITHDTELISAACTRCLSIQNNQIIDVSNSPIHIQEECKSAV